MRPLPRLALAVLAGVAAGCAFQPLALVVLLPFAVAAVTLALLDATLRQGFLLGWAFGIAFMLTLLPWLRVIGVDAWIMLSVFEGLFYALAGLGTVAVQRLPGWPVWVAAVWVGAEALRAIFPFGGFPWGRLAFATVDTPLQPLFAYVGSAGVSFAVALLGAVLAWAALRVRRAPLQAVVAVALTVVLVCGAALLPWDTTAAGPQVRVAAVQGNVPGEGMQAFAERRAVLNNHVHATRAYAAAIAAGRKPAPRLVIWPENSTDIDPYSDPTVFADIQGAVDAVGVPVLVGAMIEGPSPRAVHNEGIVWEPKTGPAAHYSKMHPVPFGEYIPFRAVIARFFTRLDQIPRDMVAGTRPGLLRIAGVPVGDVICFEVAYDSLLRTVVAQGAQMLVVQTNNATYMGTGQVEQQFAIARLQATQTGRYVVVAATDGISGILTPQGRVVERAPTRTQTVLEHRIRLSTALTPAVRWAGVVELVLSLVAVLTVLAGLLVGYRRRRPTGSRRSWSAERRR